VLTFRECLRLCWESGRSVTCGFLTTSLTVCKHSERLHQRKQKDELLAAQHFTSHCHVSLEMGQMVRS
jgi:hypothetical protein